MRFIRHQSRRARGQVCADDAGHQPGLVNCAKVTTSSYARIFGLPVADLGIAYFVVMAALCSPWAWRSQHRGLRAVRFLAALSGVGIVVWLVYVELFRLNAICIYCTAVHVLTALLFVTVAFGTAATGPPLEDEVEDDRFTQPEGEKKSGGSPSPQRRLKVAGLGCHLTWAISTQWVRASHNCSRVQFGRPARWDGPVGAAEGPRG